MDEPDAGAKPDPKELEPRPPLEADLVALCRELNQRERIAESRPMLN